MKHQRIQGKTPAGGDYSEVWYMNNNGDIVEKDFATQCMIRECLNDGTLISSTRVKIEREEGY